MLTQTETKNEYGISTFNDDALLRKIANAQPGNYSYGYWLMQYRKRISDTRLIAYQNRDKVWADGFFKDSSRMEKLLKDVLQSKGTK